MRKYVCNNAKTKRWIKSKKSLGRTESKAIIAYKPVCLLFTNDQPPAFFSLLREKWSYNWTRLIVFPFKLNHHNDGLSTKSRKVENWDSSPTTAVHVARDITKYIEAGNELTKARLCQLRNDKIITHFQSASKMLRNASYVKAIPTHSFFKMRLPMHLIFRLTWLDYFYLMNQDKAPTHFILLFITFGNGLFLFNTHGRKFDFKFDISEYRLRHIGA